MSNYTAIQTRYAGCHFRSRLEARYAVFLDTLGIRWEYESEGLQLCWRLSLSERPLYYLPDFWLPDFNTYLEAKGEGWTLDDCDRFCNAAAAINAPHGGCGDGPVVVIGGPFPRPDQPWAPWALHMHKGDLMAYEWPGTSPARECGGCGGSWVIARDVGGDDWEPYAELALDRDNGGVGRSDLGHLMLGVTQRLLTRGSRSDTRFADAITAARSARFDRA